MPISIVANAEFLPGPTKLTVEAGDVRAFFAAVKAGLGVPADVAVTMQYEDPDFNEWCEVDDLDDLDGEVQIRLQAPAGVAVNLQTPSAAAPPPATPEKHDEPGGQADTFDFGTSSAPAFTPPPAGASTDIDAFMQPPAAGSSQFQLKIVESGSWVADGHVCVVHAADLDGLIQQVAAKCGLLGVTIELFDEDFEEWCGPASLDEVMPEATIRLNATGKAPVSAPAPTPAPAPVAGSVFDVEKQRLEAERQELQDAEQMLADGKSQIHTSNLQNVYQQEAESVQQERDAIAGQRKQLDEMRAKLQQKRPGASAGVASTQPSRASLEPKDSLETKLAAVGRLLNDTASSGPIAAGADGGARDAEAVKKFLQRVPLFSDLSPEEIGRLTQFCADGSEVQYVKGDYIIKQGDEGHEFFLMTTGTAVATIDVPGLKPATVKHYYKGDYFGELALMRADSRRAANIVATSDAVTCIKLSRDDFTRLVELESASRQNGSANDASPMPNVPSTDEATMDELMKNQDLLEVANQMANASQEPMAASFCSSCNAAVRAGTKACPSCGAGLSQASPPQSAESQALAATIQARRAGMFDDVEEDSELFAKQALVDKIDRWLSGVGIGGQQMRGFDPSELVKFAWEHMHESVDPDGIYRLFVEHKTAAGKQEMSQQMGFEGMQLAQFHSMRAQDLDAFVIRSGWMHHEQKKAVSKSFKKRWFALWHDPSAPAEDLVLLIYDTPDSLSPLGVVSLQKGKYAVEPPKTPRKTMPHCMRISAQGAADGGDKIKLIVACETEQDYVEWNQALNPQAVQTRSEAKAQQRRDLEERSRQMSQLAQRFLTEGKMKVLAQTPAADLEATALRAGWLRKEMKNSKLTGGADFKRRYIILWRHPQAKHSNDFMLLHYESPEALQPDGILVLSPGKFHVGPPKSARKGYPLCVRIDGTRYHGPGFNPKLVFAADEEIEYRAWTMALENMFTGQKEDMQELAQRFLDEGMFKVLASTEATRLQSTAFKSGWVKVEFKKGVWSRRWMVMWRHPQAKETNDFVLLYYLEPFLTPEGFVTLSVGVMSACPPKSKRKDSPWSWRVNGSKSSVPGAKAKMIIAVESAEEMKAWLQCFKQLVSVMH